MFCRFYAPYTLSVHARETPNSARNSKSHTLIKTKYAPCLGEIFSRACEKKKKEAVSAVRTHDFKTEGEFGVLISDRSEVIRPVYNQVKNAPSAETPLSPANNS